jgi:hypothetical protein
MNGRAYESVFIPIVNSVIGHAEMNITLPVKSIFKPSSISMLAVSASFAAWLFPSFGVLRKGFNHAEILTLASFLTLFCWYSMIFASFFVGQKLGAFALPVRPKRLSILTLEANAVYYGFTLLASLGIGTMLVRIFHDMPVKQALLFISLGQTNALKDTLYENYSVGFVSLRYLVLYPASLALYRIFKLKQYSLINFYNILLVCVGTFLSSRLILMATLVTTFFLLYFGEKSIRVSIPKIAGFAAFLFLLLGALNLSRNANYYERNNLSFALAGASEILAYVGSPFQVAIGAAKVTDRLAAGLGNEYRDYVDVEINLNTNSAFALLLQQMGYFEWPYIAVVCLTMGFVFEALASLGKTIYLLPCGAILYASSELWRLDLFQQGTFIVWFMIGIGLPTSLVLLQAFIRFVGRLPKSSPQLPI